MHRTAPGHQRFPGPLSRRRVQGSTVERVLPEHCCSYGSQPGRLLGPFWLLWTAKKQAGAKNIFSLKKWTYGTYGLPTGPKVGQFFFLAAPKFYPRQKDPKRVLSAGAWGLVPKSAVWGPPNPEIRNLRPPKFGKKNFFRTCNIFFPKVHPKRSLTHPHRPPSDQNCPKARGPNFFPMWTCHVYWR